MITQAFTVAGKLALLRGEHQPSDVYKIALYGAEAMLDEWTAVYEPAGEVPEQGGYQSGGQVLSGYRTRVEGRTALLGWDDPAWLDATITARGALVYNATRGNAALAVLDFGEVITSTRGMFAVALPAMTAATGLMRVT